MNQCISHTLISDSPLVTHHVFVALLWSQHMNIVVTNVFVAFHKASLCLHNQALKNC